MGRKLKKQKLLNIHSSSTRSEKSTSNAIQKPTNLRFSAENTFFFIFTVQQSWPLYYHFNWFYSLPAQTQQNSRDSCLNTTGLTEKYVVLSVLWHSKYSGGEATAHPTAWML